MDIKQQMRYWVVSSEEDFAAAQSLLDKGHLRHCLFFAHLAVEKMLKAHVVKTTREIPPRIHDLLRLSQIAALDLDEAQKGRLLEFRAYLLEGRYPDSQQMPLDPPFVNSELVRMKDMLEWLKAQL
jgi:HEPN domain-containing protein